MINANFINNQWLRGSGQSFDSIDAAKNHVLDRVCAASIAEVDSAVEAATAAFEPWRACSLAQRIGFVQAFLQQLKDNAESLAQLIAAETGKPLWEATGEVSAMVGKIDISIAAYHERTGSRHNGDFSVTHKPHGVVAVFGPYNFPGHLPNGHIVPALIAGNTLVLKPSELTPLVAVEMVRLWSEAGLPKGVLNLVQGMAEVGQALASHNKVNGVFFTGSSATGQRIHQLAAGQTQRILALEMGGNNPLVVSDVADMDAAVYHIIQSAFISSGQRCTCARRLLLPEGKHGDAILSRLVSKTQEILPAVYDAQPQPFISSLVSHQTAVQLLEVQASLQQQGASVLVPMTLCVPNTGLLSPGIVDISSIYQNVADEEHFGPLLKVIRYRDFDQALALANDTRFGLSAGLLSDHADQFAYFKQHINAGIVNWNSPTTGAKGDAPFGGIGASGNHRPGAYYAADYCAYPVATVAKDTLSLPSTQPPGLPF
ncbi:succinylglutamate-semialdehyde dehydrogenase [Alteromonas sp. C1M14]|uniref:succinylglutamate-semialdehyde dehydrogenase n=1 Tax=Alteromonas sp. C1M14 TaxID=2841567 RepID=UPI001C083445|nr:succinylglutamate-semialdehyde dehydrogenase [Alteromonas sp. C1M14]MBU2978554.1 succinylglutamate-semialdehyde dehydrogenase [Alteromonas sp. C1M14]